MIRRSVALLCLALAGCGNAARPLFPVAVGEWKLKRSSDLPLDRIPEKIRRLGIRRAGVAEYGGPGNLTVERYELTSSASALEAEQTWRPAANTVAIHYEDYFTVVHWEDADRAAVSVFVREMEKAR